MSVLEYPCLWGGTVGGKVLFAGGFGICETYRVTTAEASAKEIRLIGMMGAAPRPTKGTDRSPVISDRSFVWGSVGGGSGLFLPLLPLPSRGVLQNFRAARETILRFFRRCRSSSSRAIQNRAILDDSSNICIFTAFPCFQFLNQTFIREEPPGSAKLSRSSFFSSSHSPSKLETIYPSWKLCRKFSPPFPLLVHHRHLLPRCKSPLHCCHSNFCLSQWRRHIEM